MVVPVVTLLVDPQEAEALTLANNEGHIQLLLRNSTDDRRAQTTGRQLHDLYGTVRRAEEPAPIPEAPVRPRIPAASPRTAAPVPVIAVRAPAPEPDQMIILNGSNRKVEVFAK